MKIKSILSMGLVLVTMSMTVGASSSNIYNNGDINSAYNTVKNMRGSSVLETDQYIIDLTPQSTKTTQLENTMGQRSTAPTYTSNVRFENPILSNAYVLAKSNATRPIDNIYVKARFYNSDGSLLSSDVAEETNASFVSAKAVTKGINPYYGGDYGYGNHSYEESGYKTVIHETYDEF